MARRPFRLQTVARLRESHRDAQRLRFAEAVRAEGVLRDQQQDLERQLGAVIEERRKATTVGSGDVAHLLSSQRYELTLRSQQQTLAGNLEVITQETHRRREALVAAERDVRALDRLKERAEEEERKELQRRESLALDEFASQTAHARRQTDNATPH